VAHRRRTRRTVQWTPNKGSRNRARHDHTIKTKTTYIEEFHHALDHEDCVETPANPTHGPISLEVSEFRFSFWVSCQCGQRQTFQK
jgi:hypothetical protein